MPRVSSEASHLRRLSFGAEGRVAIRGPGSGRTACRVGSYQPEIIRRWLRGVGDRPRLGRPLKKCLARPWERTAYNSLEPRPCTGPPGFFGRR